MKIYFGTTSCFERWSPASVRKWGIGGSELMLMELAWALADLGHEVKVFGEVYEGRYPSPATGALVEYLDWSRPIQACDVWVSSRHVHYNNPHAQRQFFWAHDTQYGPEATELLQRFERVVVLSEWHQGLFAEAHPGVKTTVIRNGVPKRFSLRREQRLTREQRRDRYLYASSPDRGLERALDVFEVIRRDYQPGAELHVVYGFLSVERRYRQMGDQKALEQLQGLRQRLESTPGVVMHGRKTREQLWALYERCGFLLYPTRWPETSCLVAMEAQLQGCWPLTTELAALAETVQNGAFIDDDASVEELARRAVQDTSAIEDDVEFEPSLWLEDQLPDWVGLLCSLAVDDDAG